MNIRELLTSYNTQMTEALLNHKEALKTTKDAFSFQKEGSTELEQYPAEDVLAIIESIHKQLTDVFIIKDIESNCATFEATHTTPLHTLKVIMGGLWFSQKYWHEHCRQDSNDVKTQTISVITMSFLLVITNELNDFCKVHVYPHMKE